MPLLQEADTTFDPNDMRSSDFPLQALPVTIITGQNLVRGAVLGRITASNKYNLSLSGAVDGSEDPVAVLAEDVDATAADKVAPAYFAGCFDPTQLTIGAVHTEATVADHFRGTPLFLRKRA